jgi:uncharacterized protein (TIGR02302 family)
MTDTHIIPDEAAARLRRPLLLTRAGLVAERATRAFWPFWSIVMAALAALMLGLQDSMAVEAVWTGVVVVLGGIAWSAWRGVRAFRWPTRAEAADRLDRTLPGRPLAAIADTQAIGSGDPASEAVWRTHVLRMVERTKAARPVRPDLRVSARDPFALRYVALLAFVMALLFGSVWRVASVAEMAPGGGAQALATGPVWEGWVEPPAYTGRPSLYLNDITRQAFEVPQGSEVTIRLYGEVGALTVDETVSGRTGEVPAATDAAQTFEIVQDGRLAIDGAGGRAWDVTVIPDAVPQISFDGAVERTAAGEMRQPFHATDDYGVIAGQAIVELDLAAIDRRYGLAAEPEPREALRFDLPMPISGERTDFREVLVEDIAQHPWAGLPVRITLTAEDALGQSGTSGAEAVVLPGRRFFDPLAAAIVEQRRDLLWNRGNAARVSQVLRAVSHRPEDVFRSETVFLKLRVALRRLEAGARYDQMTDMLVDETAEALWAIALEIEEGDLSDALERLRRAQEQLSEAMRNGATDEEIAALMQELREAMQDYMQQLAEQGPQDNQQMSDMQDMQEITPDQLEQMLQQLQELMEQGRMDEAQALLDQLRQMMENMQMAEGQPGQGQQSPGQQAMEGLAETLRQQQGLSDETFGDLQQQFGQGEQQGQSPGQGQQGQQGQGGEGGQQPGQPGQGQGPGEPGNLAQRQQALRDELARQQGQLPGAGTPEGDAAREALDRAGRAMEQAEESLRQDDFAGALDNQSDAMEALREGMRELGEQMAQQQGQPGQQGEAMGQANEMGQRDPLGRETGQNGRIGTDQQLLQGEDVYRRAEELLDEIRRRSGDQSRPSEERDYLNRLLDRF